MADAGPSSLSALLRARCAAHASRPLISEPHAIWRYEQIATAASKLARALRERCAPGSYVALLLPQDAHFIAALFATWLADQIPVLIDPRAHPQEIARWQRHCAIEATLSCPPLYRNVTTPAAGQLLDVDQILRSAAAPMPAPAKRSGDDIAVVLPTSGSTSAPKAVALSHHNLLSNQRAWSQRYDIKQNDVLLATLALCHSFGLTAWLLATLDAGAHAVLVDDPMPARVAQLARTHHATLFMATSAYYRYLLHSPSCEHADMQSIRLFLSGACRLPREVAEGFAEKFNAPIHQTYGLTEASPVVTATPPQANRLDSVGTALSGIELTLAEEHDGVGELCVRSPSVMRGYLHNEPATTACLDAQGWLRTGDLARIDSDGYVTLAGRKKDLIIRGGHKVFPEEIEEVLAQHPDVTEAAAVGMADARFEEVPVAFVVSASGAPQNARPLIAFCRAHLAEHKLPRQIRFLDALPRNHNGKVLKRVLREQLSERAP